MSSTACASGVPCDQSTSLCFESVLKKSDSRLISELVSARVCTHQTLVSNVRQVNKDVMQR